MIRRSDIDDDDLLDSWADDVDADRIKIDECLEPNEREWLAVVIGIPVAVLVMFVVAYVVAEAISRYFLAFKKRFDNSK